MEKFIYAFIHLGLPLLLLIEFIVRRSTTKAGLIVRSLLYFLILIFLFQWGQWAIVGSYYLRYVVLLFAVMILIWGYKRSKIIRTHKSKTTWKNVLIVISGIMVVFLIYMNISALLGKSYPAGGVELEFPLKNGDYYISSGGSKKIINNHMRSFPNAQEFAVDINKLGRLKGVSKHLLSSKREDHHIFGDTVYCPCDGEIISTKSDIRDNEAGSMDVRSEDGTGNFVEIKCDQDVIVFIPHLKMNSIMVSDNTRVPTGKPLGLVGLSGFTQEPHLHLQAARYKTDSTLVGIPIIFKGRTLSRNDLFKN